MQGMGRIKLGMTAKEPRQQYNEFASLNDSGSLTASLMETGI